MGVSDAGQGKSASERGTAVIELGIDELGIDRLTTKPDGDDPGERR